MIQVKYDGAEKKLTMVVDIAEMVQSCRTDPSTERSTLVNLRGTMSLLTDELEGTFIQELRRAAESGVITASGAPIKLTVH